MDKQKFRTLLISDFNIEVLSGYLNNDADCPVLDTAAGPFGQVFEVLLDENLQCWNSKYDVAIVWTQPQSVVESFGQVLDFREVSIDEILSQVDRYCQALLNLQDRVNVVFIPTWTVPTYHRGYGMLEMKHGLGVENILMQMNLRLSKNLDMAANVYVLNTRKWIEISGGGAFNPKLWHMGKIPFGNEVFKEATKDIKSALRGITGSARKLIVVDLDETLWGGIVGEVGWENLRLGGHDHIGEAYVEFQKALKALSNRGILLAIVSKNEQSTALEAIENHPEMVLKLEDFVGWRINWGDKAANIADLASELNLGLQSVVFIDDNPVERARVSEALGEVFVPEWPQDRMLYKKTLLSLRCFDVPSISREDLEKTKMYADERERRNLKGQIGSLDEWLKTLEITITARHLNDADLQRTAQLLNKTNQMNLSTRRMTESELANWAGRDNNKLWTFRVCDRFGDSGLTGIISLQADGKKGRIVDFVLSCRVIGRKVEETMLYVVAKYARHLALDEIFAQYIPTKKNKPCLKFWQGCGFDFDEKQNMFRWQANSGYPLPESIHFQGAEQHVS